MFIVTGAAHTPGEVLEHVVCSATIGASSKTARKAYDLTLRAEVATPLLDFSERTLAFHHAYVKGVPIETITKSLTLRCARCPWLNAGKRNASQVCCVPFQPKGPCLIPPPPHLSTGLP